MTLEEDRREIYFNFLYTVLRSWGEANLYNVKDQTLMTTDNEFTEQSPDELNYHCLFITAEDCLNKLTYRQLIYCPVSQSRTKMSCPVYVSMKL